MIDHNGEYKTRALCDKLRNTEAAYERAHQQANDALNEAARLKEDNERLEQWLREQHTAHGWDVQQLFERAEAAEARERAKDGWLKQIYSWTEATEYCAEARCSSIRKAVDAALAQQPADPVASQNDADPRHNAACGSQDAGDRPAQVRDWTTADIKPGTIVRSPSGASERWIIGYRPLPAGKTYTLVSMADGMEAARGGAQALADHLNVGGMISCGDPRYDDQPAQGERLDGMADLSQERLLADAYARGQADMRERAAQMADYYADMDASLAAQAIRNLRGDQ